MILLLLLLVVASNFAITNAKEFQNVRGGTLEPCSAPGMAQTGFGRTGSCTEYEDDLGSHHVCLDLSQLKNDDSVNFCKVTVQPDWCDSVMPCHGAASQLCPVTQWCVCQWAFAEYLEHLPRGCDDMIDTIVCDSTNWEALKAYESDVKFSEALICLKRRCSIA